jgi:HlyD family secretion protein
MDRPLPVQKWSRKRIAVLAGAGVGALMLVFVAVANFGRTRLSIESEHLSVSPVTRGEFKEYVPISGTVQPNTTVYLDLEEGGIVEKIYIQGGSAVKKGDLILSFSNTSAQKANIETETRLLENLDQLRNSKFTLTTSNLVLKDQLLDVGQKIRDLERTFARYEKLMKQPNSLITADQYETTKDQLQY